MTVALALVGALVYGFADFLGGLSARRVPPLVATAWAAVIGLVPLAVGLFVLGGTFTANAFVWGALAGIAGSVGVLMLYTALAIGPMSVLSPVTSVVSVVIPVGIGVMFAGAQLSGVGAGAIVAGVVAVALVGVVRDPSGSRLTRRGLLSAALAGCGFGGLVLAYAATSPEEGLAPLVVARVVQVCVMWLGVALGARQRRAKDEPGAEDSGKRPGIPWVLLALCGIFDASANVFIQAALHSGPVETTLPVVSVINALYPIGTVILAAMVLRERLTLVQVAGLTLALAASVVLAQQ